MALHPVAIAFQRIDLAIMREHAEGLREPPFREGIGRIALMENGDRGGETIVAQIMVKPVDLLGEEHALVNDRPRGQRRDIKIRQIGVSDALLDAPPDKIERALKLIFRAAFQIAKKYLLDFRADKVRAHAEPAGVDRHLPPAIDIEAFADDFRFNNGAALILRAEIGAREENHPGAKVVSRWRAPPSRDQ